MTGSAMTGSASGDGRTVVFESRDTHLVADGGTDAFVRHLR
jgi:hypothetical protein